MVCHYFHDSASSEHAWKVFLSSCHSPVTQRVRWFISNTLEGRERKKEARRTRKLVLSPHGGNTASEQRGPSRRHQSQEFWIGLVFVAIMLSLINTWGNSCFPFFPLFIELNSFEGKKIRRSKSWTNSSWFIAVLLESAQCVEILAAYGVDLTPKKSYKVGTPLHAASQQGLLDIVEVFPPPLRFKLITFFPLHFLKGVVETWCRRRFGSPTNRQSGV